MNGKIDSAWKQDKVAPNKLAVAVSRLFGNAGSENSPKGDIWGGTAFDASAGPSGEPTDDLPESNEEAGPMADGSKMAKEMGQQMPALDGIPDGQTGMMEKLSKQLDEAIASTLVKQKAMRVY